MQEGWKKVLQVGKKEKGMKERNNGRKDKRMKKGRHKGKKEQIKE